MADEFRPVTTKDFFAAVGIGLIVGFLVGGATYTVSHDWQASGLAASLSFGVIVILLVLLMGLIWISDRIRWRKWRAENLRK